jgi:hypothetical protein
MGSGIATTTAGLIHTTVNGVGAARLDRGVAIGRTKATVRLCGVFRSVSSFEVPRSIGCAVDWGRGAWMA